MFPQPRLLASGSLAVVLVVLAVLVDTPLLLLGAASVCGWIVARQVAFTVELERTIGSLSVTQDLERTTLQTGDTATVSLTANLATPSRLRLSIDGSSPTASSAGDGTTPSPSVTLEPGMSTASMSQSLTWPVSGHHEFGDVDVTVTDGYFRETITIDESTTVTVEPRTADRIHVGAAGKHIGMAYGDHEHGRLGTGEDPAESREYVPGDTTDKIDWKATARHGTTYVREYETKTDRPVLLVVDHRSTLADGPAGRTKFDYLRDVALSIAKRATQRGESVGLIAVDDDGISTNVEQTATGSGYQTIRRRLHDLEPTTESTSNAPIRQLTGDEARQRLAELSRVSAGSTADSDDCFASTLRPFYEERASGTDRVPVESLADSVRIASSTQQQRQRTVIFTDGARPADLRKTVSLAQRRGDEVVVFLTPDVLYEETPVGNTDAATGTATTPENPFDRYLEFEEFRRELGRMDRVTALEIGPADRLSTVLDTASSDTARGKYA